MRILFLAAANAIHTVRWVNGLAARGHQIVLASAHAPREPLHPDVDYRRLPVPAPAGYFLNARPLQRLLREVEPDLMHAHYASGYGTLARLSGFHPTLLSVWGSDVYEFPETSAWHRRQLLKNLRFADQLASTSEVMARRTAELLAGQPASAIAVTPFGVDMNLFQSAERLSSQPFCIGTVKTLAPKYGIDRLLRAFALARLWGLPSAVRLRIVGGGPQEKELKQLAMSLHLGQVVDWLGPVPHAEVPQHLQQLDLYVALSTVDSESFGVAVIEASACGLPVLVSDVGGLPEVVSDGRTGWVVSSDDLTAAAERMLWACQHPERARAMGQAGRAWVAARYDWAVCLDTMEALYQKMQQGKEN